MKHLKSFFFVKIVIVILLMSFQFNLLAQNQNLFITPINKRTIELTEKQNYRFQKLTGNPVCKNIEFVNIGRIEDFTTNGELSINIPGREEQYTAVVQEFDYFSENEYIWKGNFVDYYGNVVIFCQEGEVFGHIILGKEEFEIQTLDNNNVFLEINTKHVSKFRCGNNEEEGHKIEKEGHKIEEEGHKVEEENTNERDTKSNTGLVRILILYTSNAEDAVTNIDQTATLAVDQVNTAFRFSDITYDQLHIEIAEIRHFDYTETSSPTDDVNSLKNNSSAQNLRDQYKADLVILLTDGNYSVANGKVAMIGPSNDNAYAIVEADHATTVLTFSHEVGHLFGGRHQSDFTLGYAHGYYFKTGSIWQIKTGSI